MIIKEEKLRFGDMPSPEGKALASRITIYHRSVEPG